MSHRCTERTCDYSKATDPVPVIKCGDCGRTWTRGTAMWAKWESNVATTKAPAADKRVLPFWLKAKIKAQRAEKNHSAGPRINRVGFAETEK